MSAESIEKIREIQSTAECLYSAIQIQEGVMQLAGRLSEKLENKNPVFISILNGGMIFCSELVKQFQFPVQLDYIHLTRYRGDKGSAELHWLSKPKLSIKDRTVVLVDDILDFGYTLKEAEALCLEFGASEVLSVVLLKKQIGEHHRVFQVDDYVFECEDRYVFGYGMDYKNYFRNLNGIYAVPSRGDK